MRGPQWSFPLDLTLRGPPARGPSSRERMQQQTLGEWILPSLRQFRWHQRMQNHSSDST